VFGNIGTAPGKVLTSSKTGSEQRRHHTEVTKLRMGWRFASRDVRADPGSAITMNV